LAGGGARLGRRRRVPDPAGRLAWRPAMRLFGHPVHPMLVAFPIALLALTPIWDALACAGVLAVVTGFADLLKIPQSESMTAKVALIHAGLALGVLSLFGLAFALRGA